MFIYQITNNVNGKIYIGKTQKTIDHRFKVHISNSKKDDTYLYRAMRKYGIENFTVNMIEQVQDISLLDQREIYWISQLSPEYNMTKGGTGGDTSSSPNYIEGMKKYHKDQPKERYATYGMLGKSSPCKGKPLVKNCCPVSCEGVEYPSVGHAQAAYPGISICKRLNSPKYPQFYRLREKTRRK